MRSRSAETTYANFARRTCALALVGALAATTVLSAGQSPTVPPPVPRPFPGAAPAAPRPAGPAAEPARPTAPPAEILGPIPPYPAAEFIGDFDAGRGQRYYLYGANASFTEIVGYYRNVLKNGGREIYKAPAVQQFDVGRYDEDTMAYPPGVVVKDYSAMQPAGYLVANGTNEKRFRTLIQIVPPSASR